MASKLGTKGTVDGQSFTWVKGKNSNALVRKFDKASAPKTSKRPKARPKTSTKTTVTKTSAPKTSTRPQRRTQAPSTMSTAPTAPKQTARKSGGKTSSTSRIKTPGKDAMVAKAAPKKATMSMKRELPSTKRLGKSAASKPKTPTTKVTRSKSPGTGTATTTVSRSTDPSIARGSSKPSAPKGYSGYKRK